MKNPPTDTIWSAREWKEELFKNFPDVRELLGDPKTWELLQKVRPLHSYENLLRTTLPYAPPQYKMWFLKSTDDVEYKVALDVIFKDGAKRFTCDLLKLLDPETKAWVFTKALSWIREKRRYPWDFLEPYIIDRLHSKNYSSEFLFLLREWLNSSTYTLFIPEFRYDFTDPLWIRLKTLAK